MPERLTARTAKQLLNQTGALSLEGLTVMVTIMDVREVFGRIDFLVTPVSGSGEIWKAAHNVAVDKNPSASPDNDSTEPSRNEERP